MQYSISAFLERLHGVVDGRDRGTVAGIRNNTAIQAVNAAGTANVDILKLNASDIVEVPAANGLSVVGAENVAGNFSVATNKFTVAAASGNTTVAGTLTVTGAMTAKPNVISGSGATVTLTAAQSGSVVLMDRAAGIVFTLPAAAAGQNFEFFVTTAVTSNAYKIITAAGTELLIGGLLSDDTDSTDAIAMFNANGSTHIAVSMNGTTTGGLVGTRIKVTCLSATKWFVTGTVYGSGVVATPFATS